MNNSFINTRDDETPMTSIKQNLINFSKHSFCFINVIISIFIFTVGDDRCKGTEYKPARFMQISVSASQTYISELYFTFQVYITTLSVAIYIYIYIMSNDRITNSLKRSSP